MQHRKPHFLSTHAAATWLLGFWLLLTSLPASSQNNQQLSQASLAEKIYLQTSGNAYTTDQTIWFKAVVTNAIDHAPSRLSGVLYVELIDENENVVERKIIKIEEGIGPGFFQLNENYAEGVYLLRAYTKWNKNFGPDFFFHEYIRVFATAKKPGTGPFKNIVLLTGDTTRRLNVTFDPNLIDSLHSKNVSLLISYDRKNDTLTLKKNAANNYLLDYALPGNSPFVTLKLQTKNNVAFSKSIILNKDYTDLQFFPESGELVQGITGLLGFKAVDSYGNGKMVEGDIVNAKGEVITTFKSNHLGMGQLTLVNVDAAQKYVARLSTSAGIDVQRTFSLPAIAARGNVLSVNKVGDKFYLKAQSNYLLNDSVIIRVTCRGFAYFDVKGVLKQGRLEFSLPAKNLPEGIIAFTMMIDSAYPVAERLAFNERPEGRLQISISTDKQSYEQRDSTQLNITITNSEGQPAKANLSVLVINKDQMGTMQDTRQNLLSRLLLTSDLKGGVEKPGYYFAANTNTYRDLETLLLTQGWRKYNYNKQPVERRFQPETNLTVAGSVKGGLFQNKEKAGIELTMMTFGEQPSFQAQTTDSLGRFSFVLNEEHADNLNILIQSKGKSGTKKDFAITIDKKVQPPVFFDPIRSAQIPDTIVQAYVRKSIERKKAEDDFRASSEGVMLQEVIVKTYQMTPERRKMTDRYGKAKLVIEGDDIRAKEEKWSFGLYSVLMFQFPDKVNIIRARDGNLYAMLFNREMTLVVIDGIPVNSYDYPLIPNIPPSEVSSFEVIEYAKGFSSLFCEVFPQNCVNAPVSGNVIAIYTYGRKGLFGANRQAGIMQAAVPVFSPDREFYAPKYAQLTPADWTKPDLRALVHWQPTVRTDSAGKASLSFYNADNTGTMQVVVEAISDTGEIGYQKLEFDVRRRVDKR